MLPEVNFEQLGDLHQFDKTKTTPVLNIDAYMKGLLGTEQFEFVRHWPQIALCVDEDSETIRALSPRFGTEQSREKARDLICDAIQVIGARSECLVALCVEELCPGGLDPTDGVELAKVFIEAGAKGIIASGGTIDFIPLKIRRQTKLKAQREEGKDLWPETWLSSALWLKERVSVPVYAQGLISDIEHTLPLAADLGLGGIIDVSVKYPSSP